MPSASRSVKRSTKRGRPSKTHSSTVPAPHRRRLTALQKALLGTAVGSTAAAALYATGATRKKKSLLNSYSSLDQSVPVWKKAYANLAAKGISRDVWQGVGDDSTYWTGETKLGNFHLVQAGDPRLWPRATDPDGYVRYVPSSIWALSQGHKQLKPQRGGPGGTWEQSTRAYNKAKQRYNKWEKQPNKTHDLVFPAYDSFS